MKRSRETEEELVSDEIANNTSDRAQIRHLDGLPVSKLTATTDIESNVDMKCSLPGHKEVLSFQTYDEFQSHYQKAHTNRCLECRANLPSSHLLNVHIEECHDSFVAVKREKGEHTYSCFVEGCERKCRTPQKRRLHLIDKHMYPRNYFFAVSQSGIDGRRSLLVESGHHRRNSSAGNFNNSPVTKTARRRSAQLAENASTPQKTPSAAANRGGASTRSKPQQEEDSSDETSDVSSEESSSEEEGEGMGEKNEKPKAPVKQPQDTPDTEMEDLTGAMSSLKFVPRGVRFGRGGGKAGFSKK